jgi:prepilin-type N-terminal cleavage/methylation domain-containing protein
VVLRCSVRKKEMSVGQGISDMKNRSTSVIHNPFFWFGGSKGFTLIELIFVLVIIAALCAIGILALGFAKKKASATVALYELKQFHHAQQLYFTDHREFKGAAGDVVSNDPAVPSTFTLVNFSPSRNTSITITKENPFTAVARQSGSNVFFECNIETGVITEKE